MLLIIPVVSQHGVTSFPIKLLSGELSFAAAGGDGRVRPQKNLA